MATTKQYKNFGTYMVAHITGEVFTGERFESWPTHITVYPWFETFEYEALAGFMRCIRDIEQAPVNIGHRILGEVAMFGTVEKPIMVRQIENSTPLGVMHGLFVARFGERVLDPTYTGGSYNPHITITDADPGMGAALVVDSLCLIARTGLSKQVVAAERFSNAPLLTNNT